MARNRKEVQNESKEKEKVTHKRQQGTGVRCPKCDSTTRVKNCVAHPEKSIQGRYRECDSCGLRVYTEEQIAYVIEK